MRSPLLTPPPLGVEPGLDSRPWSIRCRRARCGGTHSRRVSVSFLANPIIIRFACLTDCAGGGCGLSKRYMHGHGRKWTRHAQSGERRAPAGADRGCHGRLRDLCWRDLLPTLKRTLLGAGEGMGNKLQGWGFSFAPFFKDAYGPDIASRYFDDFRGRSTRPAVKAHICDLAKFDGYPANVLRQATRRLFVGRWLPVRSVFLAGSLANP